MSPSSIRANVICVMLLFALASGCNKKKRESSEPPLSQADIEALRETPGKAVPPPSPPAGGASPMSEAEYVATDVEMLKKVVDVYKADGDDCDKLATDLTTLLADPKFAAMTAYEQAHPDFQPKPDALAEATVTEFKSAAGRVREKCAGNQRYRDALDLF